MTAVEQHGLRERILHEATRLFAAQGFAGTSMRELVAACECTKPALYYYFSNKEALYREVVEGHAGKIAQLIEEITKSSGSVRERLHRGVEVMTNFARATPDAMRLLQRIETSPESNAPGFDLDKLRGSHLCSMSSLMESGITRGEIDATLDVEDIAVVLLGVIHVQFEESVATNKWNIDRMHRTIDLVFEGIAQK